LENTLNQLVSTLDISAPQANIEAYIHHVKQIPILSAEEEKALAVQLQEENNLEAARQLVLSQLRFVVHVARGYSGYGLAQADLIQEGNIGLMKAVKRFDPSKEVRLVSFAVHWIKAEIHEYILRNWKIVKIATTKAQRKLFFNLRKSKKRLGWFNNDEVEAVAKDLGVEPSTVREMEARLTNVDASFNATSEQDEDSDFLAPENYLQDAVSDPSMMLEHSDLRSKNTSKLVNALSDLDERSQDILKRRWLDEDKATLHELAQQYSVSAERIRQLEKNALKKLKISIAA